MISRKPLTVLLILFLWTSNQLFAQKNPKRVILLIGDGMGLTQMSAGFYQGNGKINLLRAKYIGLITTHSAFDRVTDSAAGATAFASGVKTYNGAIGLDTSGNPVPTILEIAENKGMATGLVVTSSITHATPSAFAAHQKSRKMDEEIASDIARSGCNVLIGGGNKFFTNRSDLLNYKDTMVAKGYSFINNINYLDSVFNEQIACLCYDEQPPSLLKGRNDILVKGTSKALATLSQNNKGFFLMIEGSQIDWGGHEMNLEYTISEFMEFDLVAGMAFDYADTHPGTLVVVTADHETGGLALTGGKRPNDPVEGKYIWNEHTATMVPVYAYGTGAESFSGIYDNTDIFFKIKNYLETKNR